MWNWIMHIISILIGLLAFCFAYIRCEPITADWLNILVGVLSFSVTILLGWQVYTLIDLRNIQNKFKHIDRLFKEQTILNRGYLDFLQGETYNNNDYLFTAFREYICSADNFYTAKNLQMGHEILYKTDLLIRNIRYKLGINGNGYVRDYDFFNDNQFTLHVDSLSKSELKNALQERLKIMNILYEECDTIIFQGKSLYAYKKGILIKERNNCIYVLLKINDRNNILNKLVFDSYNSFCNYIMKELDTDYNLIALYEAKGRKDFISSYEIITKAPNGDYITSDTFKQLTK